MSSKGNEKLLSGLPKQPRVIPIFANVGMAMTALMAIIALYNENYFLASMLLLASFTYLSCIILYQKLNKKKLSASILIYSLYTLMFYLVYTGGVGGTGILWLYIVAPVTIYIQGLKRGIFDTVLFLLLVAFLMAQSNIANSYNIEYKIRFFLSFLTVTFLSTMYEYSRRKWYEQAIELTERYQHLAHFDPLTNLSNRRHALAVLEQEHARLNRGGEPTSILICDIDHFKKINDKFGHGAGDKVLSELAAMFKANVRHQDTVARWGGEEFLFILPQTNKEGAYQMANKILTAAQSLPLQFNCEQVNVTISVGVEELTAEMTLDECINSADTRLYNAKTLGRNQVC